MSWQAFKTVLPRLAAERDVIAIDLPGFGGSPRPPDGTPPGSETLTRLMIEFLDEMGLERPHVAGNSLGGLLALELAKAGRARTATALSPAGFHQGREPQFETVALMATFRMARAMRPAAGVLTATGLLRTLLVGQMYARPWRLTARDAAEALRILADATWFEETVAALRAVQFTCGELIGVPVTIAWGQHDRLLLLRQAPRAGIAIPGARLVTLYGCGHLPMSDDPEQVARVLLEGSTINE
jgi:pimeloyl-ACP methyl ester carboxylesterase